MSAEPKKPLLRVRTFAQDLATAKTAAGLAPVSDTPEVILPEVTGKAVMNAAPAVAVVSTPKEPPTIPAFHELQKKQTLVQPATPIDTKPAATPTVRIKKRDLKTPRAEKGGTVITDTKETAFKLTPSIWQSLILWWKKITTKKPTETKAAVIPSAESRKEIIQKATTQSGARAVEAPIAVPTTKPEEDSSPTIQWTPQTETGYNLLEAPTEPQRRVVVEFKRQSTPAVINPIQSAPPPAVIAPTPVEAPVAPVPLEMPEVPTQNPVVQEDSVPPELPSEISDRENEEPAYPLTTPEAHYAIRSLGDITRINTNLLSVGVVGLIAAAVIVVAIVNLLLGVLITDDNDAGLSLPTPLVQNVPVSDLVLEEISLRGILTALSETATTNTTSEYRLVGTNGVPLASNTLLTLFGIRLSPAFSSAVTEIHVITEGTAKGIVLKVTDPTSVFGSLLTNEPVLAPALGGILAIPEGTTNGTYIDQTIGSTDVRILKQTEQEILVYGFIDKNTVLITTTTTVFSNVLTQQN